MVRGIARGRMVPQSLSTDPRLGRVSLKAALLYDRLWINCDDQGRISGDPAEIKYTTCPNIDHITKEDIAELLNELETQELIKVYSTSKIKAIQMLDWWQEQKLQWAWPSRFPPPEGWQDRLRYKASAKEVVTVNWPSSPESSPESSPDVPAENSSKERESTKEKEIKEEKGKGRGKRRGRGKSPETSGENPSSSLTTNTSQILRELTQSFKVEWGRVPAGEPHKIIRREPTAREAAQLRDLAKNLSAAGGVRLDYIKQAFREAASHQKHYISYVRAILCDWLDLPEVRRDG
jgi:hypothetical protein